MQPNYFEIAKSLMVAQGQQMLDRLKQAENDAVPLTKCEHCGEYFHSCGNEDGPFIMCSDDCASFYEAEEMANE